jgi:hypothetical protein
MWGAKPGACSPPTQEQEMSKLSKLKNGHNGIHSVKDAQTTGHVTLNDDEAAVIRGFNSDIDKLKIQLADIELQANSIKNQLIAKLGEVAKYRQEKGAEFLKKHGKDPEEKGVMWNLEMESMTFTKTVQQAS